MLGRHQIEGLAETAVERGEGGTVKRSENQTRRLPAGERHDLAGDLATHLGRTHLAAQVRALIDGLGQRAPRSLLVSVDEGGGRVSRLRPVIGPTPSARALGQRPMAEIAGFAAE